jgi:hypothetical protein
MRPALDSVGHQVPRTKPTCLLHTCRPHRRRPFALVLHLHQHQSSYNLHLQYLAKSQSTQRCQSLITPGSDHPPVLEPHMVLIFHRTYSICRLRPVSSRCTTPDGCHCNNWQNITYLVNPREDYRGELSTTTP